MRLDRDDRRNDHRLTPVLVRYPPAHDAADGLSDPVGVGHAVRGQPLQLGYPTYTYDAVPGFAERDLDEYDKVSAELAWSRSLAAARKAFQRAPNMELALEQNVQGKQARARLYCGLSRSMARSYDTQGSSSRAT